MRLTLELIDFISELSGDTSLARMTVEAYINYGNNLLSAKSVLVCKEECLKGVFAGNLDVRNAYSISGRYQLVINIHGYTQDKFKLNLISLGDLILASHIFEDSKGRAQSDNLSKQFILNVKSYPEP